MKPRVKNVQVPTRMMTCGDRRQLRQAESSNISICPMGAIDETQIASRMTYTMGVREFESLSPVEPQNAQRDTGLKENAHRLGKEAAVEFATS